jgi:hypothetical protein
MQFAACLVAGAACRQADAPEPKSEGSSSAIGGKLKT